MTLNTAPVSESAKRLRLLFYSLLACVTCLRLWFITSVPLSGDEAYHWEWSRRPALGYYDHPGLTAYIIRFFTAVTGGHSEFSVRVGAVFLLTGVCILTYMLASRIAADRGAGETRAIKAGFLAGVFSMFAPITAVFSVYMSTDPPLIFFWALTLWLFYKAVVTGKWKWWVGVGLAAGMALMSKFLAFLLGVGLLAFLLVDRRGRRFLATPKPYVAALCAFVVLLPFLYWNYQHGWATFVFNFVRRQPDAEFSFARVAEYVLSQSMLAVTPGIFILAVAGARKTVFRKGATHDMGSLIMALSSLAPLLYFLAVSFRRRVGFHWPAAGWIGALVLAALFWVETGERGARLKKLALWSCVGLTALAHLAVHIPASWINSSLAYPLDRSRINLSEHAERFGWHELGGRVSQVRRDLSDMSGKGAFVICDQYGLAASVAFYSPDKIETHLWSPERAHGENYRFWDDFEALKGMDAVFVSKTLGRLNSNLPSLNEGFERVAEPERLGIVAGGEEVRAFYYVRCYGFNGRKPQF